MFRRASYIVVAAVAALGVLNAGPIVGYYTTGGGPGNWASAIAANGYTGVGIVDFSTFSFATVDIVALNNSDNGDIESAVSGRLADLTSFVSAGGVLIIHDRWVEGNGWIPGGGGLTLWRNFDYEADLDIVTGGTKVTNGPFGTITNTSLDGGTSSSHGWVTDLPGGAITFLSAGSDPSRAAAFVFPLGSGFVYYSTIPLDYYQEGEGPNPPRDNFVGVYAPNVLAYAADLQGGVIIPEPSSYVLIALGLAGLVVLRRRRA